MKKLIFILMLAILASFCLAEPSYYYKQGTKIDIKVPCVNNGTACGSSARCNMTVTYPNSTAFISNSNMTYNPSYFNYSLPNTNTTGEYQATVFCCAGTLCDYTSFSFLINSTGNATYNDIFSIFILFIALTILSVGFTIWFWLMKHSLRYAFLLLTFIFITILTYLGYKSTEYISFGIQNVMYSVYIVSLVLTFMMFFIVIVDLTIKLITYFGKRKNRDFNDSF